MSRRTKKITTPAVTWLSETYVVPNCLSNLFIHYKKFRFLNLVAEIGDFVLVSNADAAEPDTEEGCDAARIELLYEDTTNHKDPFRAKVQWYSKPSDLPSLCHSSIEPVNFLEHEVIEDHRPFSTDVSIETFFKKCTISFTLTKDTDRFIQAPYHYICRYRVIPMSKRKVSIEPVLEEERRAIQMLCTPRKINPLPSTPKTPESLIKKMGRVSLSEHKNWSVSKREGTKLLFKRDKTAKDSPKTPIRKSTVSGTPVSTRELIKENNCTMELQVTSENEPNTLIIRQHDPTTPKKKQSTSKINEQSPKTRSYSTRSALAAKNKINYVEDEISPVKRTPRRTRRATEIEDEFHSSPELKIASLLIDDTEVKRTATRRARKVTESDDDFKLIPTTPKTPRTSRTSRSTCQTPKLKVSRKNISQLTPSLQSRAHSVKSISKFVKDKSLPGREDQMNEILSFVRWKLIDGSSGCMYISGVPGTGKTATVCSALKILKEEAELPEFQLVEVNGMKIAEPRQAFVQIYKQLTGKTVVWEQACSLLTKRFTNPGPRRTPTVLLVDELDALCTRRQDVLYSIMEWAAHNTALLAVLAVANTMDLPERALAARVASRLGLTRLTFPPYTYSQLQTIVATRLAGANVTPDAMQLIARKVAAVSGDARRALALCTRALELAGPEGAGLSEVQRALAEASSSGPVTAIRHCSPAERLMLRAVAAEVERTGTDETILSRALATAGAIVALDGRPYKSAPHIRAPTPSQALAICARLASQRLLLLEPKPGEPRLLLNVSVDDVHYATKQIMVTS